MKILIIGHGRHGKDTVAELLEDYAGITFTSSSQKAAEVILPALNAALPKRLKGYDKYTNSDEAFEDRHNHRMLWKELISLYTTSDKSSLAKLVLEESDCYVGMRCQEEYRASKGLFNLVIWVDAGNRHPKDPSMSIKFNSREMLYLDNNGTLDDLHAHVSNIVGEYL